MTQHRVAAPRLSRILPTTAAVSALILLAGCAGLQGGKVPKDFRGGYTSGDKVLVMLPATGGIATTADAVRQGLLAANGADDTGARAEVAFADSSSTGKIADQYDKGVADGATQVIGPLRKSAVKSLGERESLPVTTLALNVLTGTAKPPENLYQFSLRPENEAVNVAEKAHAQGLTRAMMIYSEDHGGTRRATAFRQKWKTLGGELIADMSYKPAAKGAAGIVTKMLAEGGADFVFLAGDGAQALRLYPEMRKATAGLPVIAPGVVYNGKADSKRDQALAGLYFVDMPWMLGVGTEEDPLKREDLDSNAPYLAAPIGWRLYAMGIDAYRMAPRVAAMASDPKASFPGLTGRLSVDFTGRIQRELTLGRFTADGPEAVESIVSGPVDTDATNRTPRPEPASKG